MATQTTFQSVFSNVFEPELLAELESKSILMNVSSGETLMKIGKPVTGVPLMISGAIKVSRMNDDGQEILLYYITAGETCPMSLTCFMTSQLSSVSGMTEDDSSFYVVPGKVVEEL